MKRALPLIGIMLIMGGLVLLGALAWEVLTPSQSPSPFVYKVVAEGKAGEAFPTLGLTDQPDLKVRKYELRVPDIARAIATFHVAYPSSDKPVLLDWSNALAEPVITVSSSLTETTQLAKAFAKHAMPGSIVLGWGDISRRLKFFVPKTEILFEKNPAHPLFVPALWADRREAIAKAERVFWKRPTNHSTPKFDIFVDALLSDEKTGAEKLRELTGGREAIIVLNISDAYRLGTLAPDRFSVGYKDFAETAKVHGLVQHVKRWIKKNNHTAYTVQTLGGDVQRVFFLSNEASTQTLIAKLLPFNTSNPFQVEALSLLHKQGDYWVYKLTPPNAVVTKGS